MTINNLFKRRFFISQRVLLSLLFLPSLFGEEEIANHLNTESLNDHNTETVKFVNSTDIPETLLLPDHVMMENDKNIFRRKCRTINVCDIINCLNPGVAAFVNSILNSTPIQCLTPVVARATLDAIQNVPVNKCPTYMQSITIPVNGQELVLNIIRPINSTGVLPIIMYFHGAGWELGDEFVFDRLIRQLSSGTKAALVFVNYTRTPEAQFPVAINQAYAATKYIAENAASLNLDASRMAVAGDSVGGNMAAVVTLMAKAQKFPSIIFQVLFYPVTQPCFDTPTYIQFADGPWLTRAAMMHYWNLYLPNVAARNNPLASPLRATLQELSGLPPGLGFTNEFDVLRNDGQWYFDKLRQAGVKFQSFCTLGTIHDAVMLNPLATTAPTIAAIALAQQALREAFGT